MISESKILDMLQNEGDVSERNLIKLLSSSQKDKVIKGLWYYKENFSTLEMPSCVKMIHLLPSILRNSSNEIIDLSLDLIRLIY